MRTIVEETEKLVDELFEIYHGIPGLSIGDIKFNCYQISGQLRYSGANNYNMNTSYVYKLGDRYYSVSAGC